MKGLNLDQMEFLAAKGLSLGDVIELAKMGEKPRSSGAERQARYRRRKKGITADDTPVTVTSDVTRDASLPPYEVSTPPVSSDEETTPPAKVTVLAAKPDEVSDQVWADFQKARKARRAPVTPTVIEGIAAEAAKAGWSMDAALRETVSRGWQGFKAEWVDVGKPPGASGGSDIVSSILGKQAATV